MNAPLQPAATPGVPLPPPAAKPVLALMGFSAAIGQIVLMRELMAAFNGNEMSLGILLATWLFWTAAGSWFSGCFRRTARSARRTAAALECLLGLSMPPAIWAVRSLRGLLQTVPGEMLGAVPMLLASLVSLSVFCLLSGALFVAASRMVEAEGGVSAEKAASSAYLLDAAGSALGGLAAGLALLRFLDSFQIAIVVALLNLWMAAALIFRLQRRRRSMPAIAAAGAMVLLLWVAPRWDWSSRERMWPGFRLVASRDSIYGNLTVIEAGGIRSIYDNGSILANAPDENAAEEAVHYALLEHPAPRRVLLIGGGVNGSIAEALKHPSVERIDYVELDPALIGMTRQFFPAQFAPIVSDPRVHLHYADGRNYLRTAGGAFDAIVLDAPDPQTAQLNRFYTEEFFRSARDRLAPGGVLALELRSSEETIGPDLGDYLRCIRGTLEKVFPYTAAIPGETLHYFAATRPGVLTDDPQALMERLRERNLKTQYVREYFIPFRMMPDRMAQVQEQLTPLPSTPINRDFAPIAYYFNAVLWSAQFQSGYSNWFRAAAQIPFNAAAGAALTLSVTVASLLAWVAGRPRRARAAAASCAAGAGFTAIALEILLLLAFQSVYGYVYHQLTLLIGLCMAGMALGSWLSMRRMNGQPNSACRTMAAAQLLLALSAPGLIFAVGLLARSSGTAAAWLGAQWLFPALAALAGMLGGFQFPVAASVYIRDRGGRRGLGAIYAIDLAGGCVGALLVSSYLIPVFGFWKTAWLSAAINLAPALLAALAGREEKRMGS